MDKLSADNYNGLKLTPIQTIEFTPYESDMLSSYAELNKKIAAKVKNPSYAVAYLDYKVLIGKFESEKLAFFQEETFEPNFLQMFRVFNQEEELLFQKTSQGIKTRYRRDRSNPNSSDFAIEALQILFGTQAEELQDGYTRLTEARGTELVVPFSNIDKAINRHRQRLVLETRNYIGVNRTTQQCGYIDCRFLNIRLTQKENGKLK